MNKWNSRIFDNINISKETYNQAFALMNEISQVDLMCAKLFSSPQDSALIFAFVESKYSSQIEGIPTTLYDNVNTGLVKTHQKTLEPIVAALFSKEQTLSREFIDSIANAINHSIKDKGARWKKSFGIYKTKIDFDLAKGGKKEIIFQPPLEKDIVDMEMNKFYQDIQKDVSIIDHIISHIKFEMIHPYPDGNGRVGRVILQKQISKTFQYNEIIPISWCFYKQNSKYYQALDIAYTDINKSVIMFLEMIKHCVLVTKDFLNDLETFKNKYIQDVKNISKKVDDAVATKLLLTLQHQRLQLENNFDLNVRTVESIFQNLGNILPFNRVKVLSKVTYWNIELEEIIGKHFYE